MRLRVVMVLALAAALFLMPPQASHAQPQPTLVFPEDGAVFSDPPPVLRLCFAEPVNIRDLDDGGDFRFAVVTPQGTSLGLRIVFQRDGLGVDVHRGIPQEPVEGNWTFDWRVTDPETLEAAEGRVSFTVGPEGRPAPEEPPVSCAEAALATPEATPSPTAQAAGDDGDGGSDTLVLLTAIVGSVVGVAALSSIAYFLVRLRRRSSAP